MYNFEMRPFRIWCAKVLPLVYDESLSYYELLCKVLRHLNLAIEDINELKQIVEGGLDIEEIVEEKIDELVENGTMDKILENSIGNNKPGISYTTNPIFDFNEFADELYLKYHPNDLSDWDATKIKTLWDGLISANAGNSIYRPFSKVNAFEVSEGVYSPAYVWRARKNYQTTHFGEYARESVRYKTKYGMISNEIGGEPTFLITVGDRGGDKNNEAVFYELFKAWTEGKYNGDYILNNYNFIILPLINYIDQDAGSGDSLRNQFVCGYSEFVSTNPTMCNKIETFFDSGVRNIISSITCEDIDADEKWRYNQKIVHINIANFTWSGDDMYWDEESQSFKPLYTDEDEHGYGIVYRGHTIRENNSEKILFDASMAMMEQVKEFAPKLFAGDKPSGTSQVHIGNNSYHSIISASSQNGYKCLNLELPRRVGETWEEYSEERGTAVNSGNTNTKNTFLLGLMGVYNTVISAMKYLDMPLARIYSDLWSLGFWIYNGGLDSSGNHAKYEDSDVTKPYKKIDIDDVIKRLPPGSIGEFSLYQYTYGTSPNAHYADMSMFYENLPKNKGGVLFIQRGEANEGLELSVASKKGKVEYYPSEYYVSAGEASRYYYGKIQNDGSVTAWYYVDGEVVE
ncbi:MAG: hypothetical protein J6V44_09515 [Methanobrevibacter sp.]|nr:hypothetical protein [Methanobrevibacter sp.]